ncbi:hypothetical protein [Actinotalea sp. K2]|uniref:hypothetical protein n=1 Tax=Actinotalea sp. K2 TaxID=2939438 RepID=UPI002016D8DA|nr:hypothetical protein [Actinotalea sp. K2]MCL3861422.1 hypothetical protein [Actinotalea sp. K2]
MNENTGAGSPPTGGGDQQAAEGAVVRLRAADPAADLAPDSGALREAVRDRVEAPDATSGETLVVEVPGVADVPEGAQTTDELAAARERRDRRWTSWPARVAGVAAAALLVGAGGGYAVGAAGSSDAPVADGPILLDGTSPGAPQTEMMGPMGGDAAAMEDRAMFWPGYFGRTVFTAQGLSDQGGTAAAWAYDATAVFSADTLVAAAASLGIAGEPRQEYGSWTIGPIDGSGPVLQLQPDGMGTLSMYDPTRDPWSCGAVSLDTEQQSGAAGDSGPSEEAMRLDPEIGVMPVPECQERDLGPAPTGEAAEAVLRDVLASLGIDAGGLELVVEEHGDPQMTFVTAYQVLDGQRTGAQWSAQLVADGVQSLYGSLAPLVELGDLDVVSPTEAVERLVDPRFGGGQGGPIAYAEGSVLARGTSETMPVPEEPTVPPTVQPGASFRWPVTEAVITQARLGVAVHTQPDGAAVLLPTYELTSSEGGIWSVVAVTDAHLDFSDAR